MILVCLNRICFLWSLTKKAITMHKGPFYRCGICGVHFTEIESRSFKVCWRFGGPAGWLKYYGCKRCSHHFVDDYDYDVDNDTEAHSFYFPCGSYDSCVSYASYVFIMCLTLVMCLLCFLHYLNFLGRSIPGCWRGRARSQAWRQEG